MAVVIETTIGDFTIDLFTESRPQASKNFLKLCKVKYYNFCLFHSIQPNFLAQTGDPSGTGSEGESIYGVLYGENTRYFEAEIMPKLKHYKPGLLSMVNCGNNMLGSQFFITLGEELVSLDGEHCVFGEITEGAEIIHKLNEAICDSSHRPYKDIRITHTVILEDPFEDPSELVAPDASPELTQEKLANGRIGADEEVDETAGLTTAEIEERRQEQEAKARATILEIVGDLPDADVAPPENVLFVCKLNPVTTDEDLEIIFNRFGPVKSCEIIRDKTTGDSLQYAFVEFIDRKSCEEAYFKMDNVLIDDRRIHVDFSQSTAKEKKIMWKGKGKGIEYLDQEEKFKDNRSKESSYKDREASKTYNNNRREKDFEDRARRREKPRNRDDERQSKGDRRREKDSRERRRHERDCSRSDYRKRDSKHRRSHQREDDKRYEKRLENESMRQREDDIKQFSTFNRKIKNVKYSQNTKSSDLSQGVKQHKEEESNYRRSSSAHTDSEKNENLEKLETRQSADKFEIKPEKVNPTCHLSSYSEHSSNIITPNKPKKSESKDKFTLKNDISPGDQKIEKIKPESQKSNLSIKNNIFVDEVEDIRKELSESHNTLREKTSEKSNTKHEELNPRKEKKSTLKRSHKVSESKKRKKRRYSSSSESSSDSSDSTESSSTSDSSDYKRTKKRKLIIAKKYYRGGKLVKEVKKKKRTEDTSDSESISDESSDSECKRRRKYKKSKKGSAIKQTKKLVHSSDDSPSETSSSENSDVKIKRKKKKSSDKQSNKRQKFSSKKINKVRNLTSSSSDSEINCEKKLRSKK